MQLFITGATGWVGSAVAEQLLGAGHDLTGLARSDAAAAALARAGIGVCRGSLEDLDVLAAAAEAADGVVHLAFNHDFSRFAENGVVERRAIEALGGALAGSGRPLVVTSGVGLIAPGRVVTEDDPRDSAAHAVPRDPETAAASVAARGVRVAVIRLAASVHGDGDHGFVPRLIAIARERGVSAFVGDGTNRWPAVHRRDAARLYRLALDRAAEHAVYHAVADGGVALRDIAERIGKHLQLPVTSVAAADAGAHFGWLAPFVQMDAPAASTQTRAELGWEPVEVGLLADLDRGVYFRT